ncbi:MAG: hypothetical protein HEEMFOPI_00928 [Holosporales bacterium]
MDKKIIFLAVLTFSCITEKTNALQLLDCATFGPGAKCTSREAAMDCLAKHYPVLHHALREDFINGRKEVKLPHFKVYNKKSELVGYNVVYKMLTGKTIQQKIHDPECVGRLNGAKKRYIDGYYVYDDSINDLFSKQDQLLREEASKKRSREKEVLTQKKQREQDASNARLKQKNLSQDDIITSNEVMMP